MHDADGIPPRRRVKNSTLLRSRVEFQIKSFCFFHCLLDRGHFRCAVFSLFFHPLDRVGKCVYNRSRKDNSGFATIHLENVWLYDHRSAKRHENTGSCEKNGADSRRTPQKTPPQPPVDRFSARFGGMQPPDLVYCGYRHGENDRKCRPDRADAQSLDDVGF